MNTAERIVPALRQCDTLYVWDNSKNNLGFGAAANRAARQGRGDSILFVNPDGDLACETLTMLENTLEGGDVVAVAARQGNRRQQAIARMRQLTPGMQWVPAACLAVRRSAFVAAGGFDERLFMYGEDIDLCMRIATLGRVVEHGQAIFHHDEHNPNRYTFKMQHYNFRNILTVTNWYANPRPSRIMLDGIAETLAGHPILGLARFSGALEFQLRTRHWKVRSLGS